VSSAGISRDDLLDGGPGFPLRCNPGYSRCAFASLGRPLRGYAGCARCAFASLGRPLRGCAFASLGGAGPSPASSAGHRASFIRAVRDGVSFSLVTFSWTREKVTRCPKGSESFGFGSGSGFGFGFGYGFGRCIGWPIFWVRSVKNATLH
jgi:hypothetical protein